MVSAVERWRTTKRYQWQVIDHHLNYLHLAPRRIFW